MCSTATDTIRAAYKLFVWAQLELQLGIMCASAPALRVFFRRYLGGSQDSHGGSSNSAHTKSITVIRDTTVAFEQDGSAHQPTENLDFHEMQELGAPRSDDGEDGLSRSSRAKEPLTFYTHEEDKVCSRDSRI